MNTTIKQDIRQAIIRAACKQAKLSHRDLGYDDIVAAASDIVRDNDTVSCLSDKLIGEAYAYTVRFRGEIIKWLGDRGNVIKFGSDDDTTELVEPMEALYALHVQERTDWDNTCMIVLVRHLRAKYAGEVMLEFSPDREYELLKDGAYHASGDMSSIVTAIANSDAGYGYELYRTDDVPILYQLFDAVWEAEQ